MDDQNETEEKKTRKANLLEEFGGQLIDGFITLIGELFIYIIFYYFQVLYSVLSLPLFSLVGAYYFYYYLLLFWFISFLKI